MQVTNGHFAGKFVEVFTIPVFLRRNSVVNIEKIGINFTSDISTELYGAGINGTL